MDTSTTAETLFETIGTFENCIYLKQIICTNMCLLLICGKKNYDSVILHPEEDKDSISSSFPFTVKLHTTASMLSRIDP